MVAAAVFAAAAAGVNEQAVCRPLDSLLLKNDAAAVNALSAECFCEGLSDSRNSTAALVPVVERYSRAHVESDSLLVCAWRSDHIRKNASLSAAIFHEWETSTAAPLLVLQRCLQRGDFRRADTLCTILDSYGKADVPVLMRWIDAKKITGDLEPVPQLFCRIIADKPSLLSLALSQFSSLLEDVEGAQAVSLIGSFSRCCSVTAQTDSGDVLTWLLEQYGSRNVIGGQIAAVKQFEVDREQQCGILRNMGELYQREGRSDAAITLGNAAWRTADSGSGRRQSAALLFSVYSALGKDDSARVWMQRAGSSLRSELAAITAITVFQATGALDSAGNRLHRLQPSAARDSLTIRQYLLTDSVQAALRFVYSDTCRLTPATGLNLWKLRCALYAGGIEKVRAVIDSSSSRELSSGSELTACRYWILRLADNPEELAKFSTIQYTLFKGDRRKAAEIICGALKNEPNRWRFAVLVAQAQIAHREYADAMTTLACAPADSEPEYLYRSAQALLLNGKHADATEKIRTLLEGYPGSVFAVQGRMLLKDTDNR